jgi:hypothetical protein
MTASVEAADVRPIDRFVNAIRSMLEHVAPWYDPAEARFRRAETERVRRRSIAARIRAENDIAARYRAADGAMRK